MKTVHADVTQITALSLSLNLSFAVHVLGPVEMAPRIYNITYQEVMAKTTSAEQHKRVLTQMLSEKVLADYNLFIENHPIMDMLTDPSKYETCSNIKLNLLNMNGRLIM